MGWPVVCDYALTDLTNLRPDNLVSCTGSGKTTRRVPRGNQFDPGSSSLSDETPSRGPVLICS